MLFRFSDDEKYAYRIGIGMRGFWLQVEPQPVGSVEAKCNRNAFLQGVRFKHPDAPDDPSREYEREKLPFNFWKVNARQRIERNLPESDLFVQDYRLHEEWEASC